MCSTTSDPVLTSSWFNCAEIIDNPINLPCCECQICAKHLHENEINTSNIFTCKSCHFEYTLKEDELQTNELLENMLKQQTQIRKHSIKLEIDQSIIELFELSDELRRKKPSLEVDIYDYFSEIRREIDIHREEAKISIEENYRQMIESANNTEAHFMEQWAKYERQGSEQVEDRNVLEEKFRDPQLSIDDKKAMKLKQDEENVKIKLKLKELDELKERMLMNKFIEMTSRDIFGYLNIFDSFDYSILNSKILTSQQCIDLMRTCEFPLGDKWTLLYRASKDGFRGIDFHSKCDGHANTLTIIKAYESSYIFGGYTSAAWESFIGQYKPDIDAFIFSLVNKDNMPAKLKVNDPNSAIFCRSSYGPEFGSDISIADKSNANKYSFSRLGWSYQLPFGYSIIQARDFLAGSRFFQVSDIEVFSR